MRSNQRARKPKVFQDFVTIDRNASTLSANKKKRKTVVLLNNTTQNDLQPNKRQNQRIRKPKLFQDYVTVDLTETQPPPTEQSVATNLNKTTQNVLNNYFRSRKRRLGEDIVQTVQVPSLHSDGTNNSDQNQNQSNVRRSARGRVPNKLFDVQLPVVRQVRQPNNGFPTRMGKRSKDGLWYLTKNDETVYTIAKRFGLQPADIVIANADRYPALTQRARMMEKTLLRLEIDHQCLKQHLARTDRIVQERNLVQMRNEDVDEIRSLVLIEKRRQVKLLVQYMQKEIERANSQPTFEVEQLISFEKQRQKYLLQEFCKRIGKSQVDIHPNCRKEDADEVNRLISLEERINTQRFITFTQRQLEVLSQMQTQEPKKEQPPLIVQQVQQTQEPLKKQPRLSSRMVSPPKFFHRTLSHQVNDRNWRDEPVRNNVKIVVKPRFKLANHNKNIATSFAQENIHTSSNATQSSKIEEPGLSHNKYTCVTTGKLFGYAADKMTSSVSYMTPTLMKQQTSVEIELLAPLTMRPEVVYPVDLDLSKMDLMYHNAVENSTVAMTILSNLGGEASLKNYLMCLPHGAGRKRIVDRSNKVVHVQGLVGAEGWLHRNNSFLCLHYHLERGPGENWTVSPVHLKEKQTFPSDMTPEMFHELGESNMQIGIFIRKGKAGTGKAGRDTLVESLRTLLMNGSNHGTSFEEFVKFCFGIRLELYVEQRTWKKLPPTIQKQVVAFSHLIEDHTLRRFTICNRQAYHALVHNGNLPRKSPLYFVATRDSFSHSLVGIDAKTSQIVYREGGEPICGFSSEFKAIDWYFANDLPAGFNKTDYPADEKTGLYPVGLRTYIGVFSRETLKKYEDKMDEIYLKSTQETTSGTTSYPRRILPETCHHTAKRRSLDKISRTKMFFNARYLWTAEQLGELDSDIARGVRVDVSRGPRWMRTDLEQTLVDHEILETGFVNSFACNIYHDGSEGLGQHYDDIDRFEHPVVSVRLFSDSRLSFGCKLYGFSNGLFTLPMPRGGVTVMRQGGYASTQSKHCIRPADMEGKSGVLLLRHIHQVVLDEAFELEVEDITSYMSSVTFDDDGTPWLKPRGLRESFLEKQRQKEVAHVLEKIIRGVEKGQRTVNIRKDVIVRKQRRTTYEKPEMVCSYVLNDIIRRICAEERYRKRQIKERKQCKSCLDWVVDVVSYARGDEQLCQKFYEGRQRELRMRNCRLVLNRIIRQIEKGN